MTETEPDPTQSASPRWNSTTKLVVAFTFVAILAGLLIRFRVIIGPLLIAFILAYLLYPLANFLHRRVKISWRLSATLVFLILLLIFLGLLTWGGFAVVEQAQSLIRFLQTQIRNLPQLITELTSKPIEFGLFHFDFATLDLTALTNQLLSLVQPLLSNTASVLGSIATGTATTIGWAMFSMLVGYFILADSGGKRSAFFRLQIPGSGADIKRIQFELSHIWNAFLRGQMIIFFITVALYIILLGSLGVSFYFGLAFLAGLARFVPYVGPAIAWITYGLVALLQGSTIFGLNPFPYALLVVGIAWVTDIIMDNLVVPRLMGDTLKVHPGAVMVAAIVFASLFGVIGVILAAPVLATGKLVFTYAFRKMFDIDPWEGVETWGGARETGTFQRLRSISRWFINKLRILWAWLSKRWRADVPRIRNTSRQVAKSIRRKTARLRNTSDQTNPGGESDD
jgi:predicted PurR-regulated permease PerM